MSEKLGSGNHRKEDNNKSKLLLTTIIAPLLLALSPMNESMANQTEGKNTSIPHTSELVSNVKNKSESSETLKDKAMKLSRLVIAKKCYYSAFDRFGLRNGDEIPGILAIKCPKNQKELNQFARDQFLFAFGAGGRTEEYYADLFLETGINSQQLDWYIKTITNINR
jgi:hypothetical protein